MYEPKPCELACAPGSYCDFSLPICGNNAQFTAKPTCEPSPAGCPDDDALPTCGCDNVVYDSACEAAAAGVSVSSLQNCPTPSGLFPCGPLYCAIGTTFCTISVAEASPPASYECRVMPTQCLGEPSCDCVKMYDASVSEFLCTECGDGALLLEMYAPK